MNERNKRISYFFLYTIGAFGESLLALFVAIFKAMAHKKLKTIKRKQ